MARLNHPELVALVFETVDKLFQVEKERVLNAEGVTLHPSEIHLLLFLHEHPDANATEIARRSSVTKGAVSQTLARLEGKGVLMRGRREESPTELSLGLTEKGERLMIHALRVKEAAEERFDRTLASLTEPEREAIARFLQRLNRE